MARIIFAMLMSLDGYIEGPEGGPALPVPAEALHWHFNAEMKKTVLALYGRRLYQVMRVWEDWDKSAEATDVEIDFAHAWQKTPKIVFSGTLRELGPNAQLAKGDIETVVRRLKAETDGDISVGGAGLAASLSRLGLIDEYHLYLYPVVLGGGKPFFGAGQAMNLKLLGSESLAQEVMLLRYGRSD